MFLVIFIVFMLDFISKLLVIRCLDEMESIKIIGNFLRFTHVNNTGAAFSLFSSNSYFVLIMSLIIIISLIIYIRRNKKISFKEKIAYAMIIGGALGNLFDRIVYKYVVDFIDIKIFSYNYPIFNLADSFIVIGVILIIIFSWRNEHDRDSSK